MIRTVEEGRDFPYLIMVLFLLLKYKEPCLGCLLLGFIGVLRDSRVAMTPCFVFPYERLI